MTLSKVNMPRLCSSRVLSNVALRKPEVRVLGWNIAGSGNKWPLVSFKSARLEQLGDMLTFCKGLIVLFYGTSSLSH